ncbi:MAG: hypothetical protein RL670_673 [Actinomycetota bacterium]
MSKSLIRVVVIWVAVTIFALAAMLNLPSEQAFVWFGAILAGSIASVSIAHLIKAAPAGFVRELVYAGGGSYLILAIASLFVFLKG